MAVDLPEGEDLRRVRFEKNRVLAQVSQLATDHAIRVLVAGGPVFAAQGLISPRVSRYATFIVDVAAVEDLLALLHKAGWVPARNYSGVAVLPSVMLMLVHPQYAVSLALYTVFPGFYAEPKRVFAILWARRKSMTLAGTKVAVLDRLCTVMMAVHDRLGPQSWNPRAHNFEVYHIEQFAHVLAPRERKELLELVQSLGAIEPMRLLLGALHVDAGPVVLPTESYARWRLMLPSASRATQYMLALAECPPQRRWSQSRKVMRAEPRTVLAVLPGIPRALWLILTSRHRVRGQRRRLARLGQ